jgi:hypothetical protein
MYTVTRSRHQSKTKYLIGVCINDPAYWVEDKFPEFEATQITFKSGNGHVMLVEYELRDEFGRNSMIISFKKQINDIKFNDITLTIATKSLL